MTSDKIILGLMRLGYTYHHTAWARGYVRKGESYTDESPRYGIRVHVPNAELSWRVTSYHQVSYYQPRCGIKRIEFKCPRQKNKRHIKVKMWSGNVITIVPCHESWEQFGGVLEELKVTQSIAEKYNKWLHGADK